LPAHLLEHGGDGFTDRQFLAPLQEHSRSGGASSVVWSTIHDGAPSGGRIRQRSAALTRSRSATATAPPIRCWRRGVPRAE
jgi:hypothetical protein